MTEQERKEFEKNVSDYLINNYDETLNKKKLYSEFHIKIKGQGTDKERKISLVGYMMNMFQQN